MNPIFEKLFRGEPELPLEHKMLNISLAIGVSLTVIAIIVNIAIGLGSIMVYPNMAIGTIWACILYISVEKRLYNVSVYLSIGAFLLLYAPFMWIFNGGVLGAFPYYIVLFSSMTTILIPQSKRWTFFLYPLTLVIVLIAIEQRFPYIIRGYSNNAERFSDISFAVIMTVIVNTLLSATIAHNYSKENKKAVESNEQLQHQIAERLAAEDKIRQLAYFDVLTGLPNRTLLADYTKHAIEMSLITGEPLAVMFMDLDGFKNINDTLGHHFGDQLLIKVGERLKSVLRQQDVVSRLGGDEFIILLHGTDIEGSLRVAEKLLIDIARPCYIDEYELAITSSIGIAVYPMHGKDIETLFKCADIAMYESKQSGRNSCRLCTPDVQHQSERRLQLANALRHALEGHQFTLHYQPQVSLGNGRIVGVEALLRWEHPKLGDIPPAEFIPVAEENGLIVPIGEWVLRTAVHQMKTWIDLGLNPLPVAVNLSAMQLRQRNLSDLIATILEEAELPAKYLELEITESVTMKDPKTVGAVIAAIQERGVRMVIDDFGIGHTSLANIKRFHIGKVKIDKGFVDGIGLSPDDEAIIAAVLSLAKSLRLRTIAEGVENVKQLEFLLKNGCEEAQGYHFTPSLPADTLLEWMAERATSFPGTSESPPCLSKAAAK